MSLVPAPIENSISRALHSFASRKWPPSWGAIMIRKAPAMAMMVTSPLTSWVTSSAYRSQPHELRGLRLEFAGTPQRNARLLHIGTRPSIGLEDFFERVAAAPERVHPPL